MDEDNKDLHLPESVLKREQERIAALKEKRKQNEDDDDCKGNENNDFLQTFNENFEQIKTLIAELETTGSKIDKDLIRNKITEINKEINLLNHYVVDSKIFLTAYDMRKYNLILQELKEKCNYLEDQLLPRKKFGFKKVNKQPNDIVMKNNEETIKKIDEIDCLKKKNDAKRMVTMGHEKSGDIGFYNRNNETLTLDVEEVYKKNLAIANIENCTIEINGTPSSVFVNNVRNSKICIGPVCNSIFIDVCEDSTLYVCCHQLRIHNSKNSNIYLYVTSRPIIEHSETIRVAPNLMINVGSQLFENSSLDANNNYWNLVNDFNWLSTEKQSPNWSILDESDRQLFSR